MTQDDILNGRLVCEIGIAPVKPAEDADETWNGPVPSFLSLSAL